MTGLIEDLAYIIIIIIGIYIVIRIIKKIISILQKKKIIPRRKPFLSSAIKAKADSYFNKFVNKFKRRHKRAPTKGEFRWMAADVSHMIIKGRSHKSHWGRQKIRKYLLEKNHIVKNYIMR